MTLPLALLCVFVGSLWGATGVGGVLLIPAIQYVAGISIGQASATALLAFLLTSFWGVWLHWRAGTLRKELALPQCAGGLLFGWLGAMTKPFAGDFALSAILALLIIFSGFASLVPPKPRGAIASPRGRFLYLFLSASVIGFLAGLTGTGGPILSIPCMVFMGFPPLLSVASSLPFQICASSSGSLGNALQGYICWELAFFVALLQGIGFFFGLQWAKRTSPDKLRTSMAWLCILTGLFILYSSALPKGFTSKLLKLFL